MLIFFFRNHNRQGHVREGVDDVWEEGDGRSCGKLEEKDSGRPGKGEGEAASKENEVEVSEFMGWKESLVFVLRS